MHKAARNVNTAMAREPKSQPFSENQQSGTVTQSETQNSVSETTQTA